MYDKNFISVLKNIVNTSRNWGPPWPHFDRDLSFGYTNLFRIFLWTMDFFMDYGFFMDYSSQWRYLWNVPKTSFSPSIDSPKKKWGEFFYRGKVIGTVTFDFRNYITLMKLAKFSETPDYSNFSHKVTEGSNSILVYFLNPKHSQIPLQIISFIAAALPGNKI